MHYLVFCVSVGGDGAGIYQVRAQIHDNLLIPCHPSDLECRPACLRPFPVPHLLTSYSTWPVHTRCSYTVGDRSWFISSSHHLTGSRTFRESWLSSRAESPSPCNAALTSNNIQRLAWSQQPLFGLHWQCDKQTAKAQGKGVGVGVGEGVAHGSGCRSYPLTIVCIPSPRCQSLLGRIPVVHIPRAPCTPTTC
jgi:hypothetical protein